MSCLGTCFGSFKKQNKLENNLSTEDIAKNVLFKFNSNIFKKPNPTTLSPFRTTDDRNNFQLKRDNYDDTHPKRSRNNQSPIKRLMSKQRFSTWNQENMETITKPNNSLKKPSSSFFHWEKKDKFKCLFCGGATCKHENYLFHKNPVIIGLHSDFITDEIIASQRPSTILINKHNIITQFKELNIGLIVNVQREGEHPYCGPNKKLEDSGFTYNPHMFIAEDIKCRNSGWKDMAVPESVTFMIDIVKEMAVSILEENTRVN